MTLLAGLTRRAEKLYRRRNGARIGMEGDRENLPQTGKLRSHKPSRSRPDVAIDTFHPRVRRILIGLKLGGHHGMTSRPAETRRIHVLHAPVGCGPKNEQVDQGGQKNPLESAPHYGQAEIDGGEHSRQSSAFAQTSPPEPYAKGDQEQAEYEDARKDQKDQQTDVRVRRPRQEHFIEPESDGGKRRACGNHGAR